MSGPENVCSDWHEDVGSNVFCHLLPSQCFLLSSAGLQAVSLILSASLGFRDLFTKAVKASGDDDVSAI